MKLYIKINRKIIKYILILIVFFQPPALADMGTPQYITQLWAALRYTLSFYYLFEYIIKYKNTKYNTFWKLVLVLVIDMILSTLINGTFYLTGAISNITILGFVSLCLVSLQKNEICYMKAIYYLIYSALILNVCLQIIFPAGLVSAFTGDNRIWILSTKNYITIDVILILLLMFYQHTEKCESNMIVDIFVVGILSIINRSSTGIIVYLIIVIPVAFVAMNKYVNKSITRLFQNIIICIGIVAVIVFMSFVVFQNKSLFIFKVLASLFNKDITFSGRTSVWTMAIKYIKDYPLWGQGMDVSFFNMWGNAKSVYSAHNTLLDIAVRYGIPSAIILTTILIITLKNVAVMRPKTKYYYFSAVFISLMVAFMFEATQSRYATWAVLTISYYFARKNKANLIGDHYGDN